MAHAHPAKAIGHRPGRRLALAALGLLLAALGVLAARSGWGHWQQTRALAQRVAERQPGTPDSRVACQTLAAARPLVLLALGQSNAANHGERRPGPGGAALAVIAHGGCHRSAAPLPGATGAGGSLWPALAGQLGAQGVDRPLVLGLLAVDATTIDDWLRRGSPLPDELSRQLRHMASIGLPPDLVLWQQGEADARAGTTTQAYAQALQQLAGRLRADGVRAPLLVARSTVCNSPPSTAIRQAQDLAAAADGQIRIGPDTDTLTGARYRLPGGCHWTADGIDAAAQLWAQAIAGALPVARSTPPR